MRVTSVTVKPWQRGTLAYQAPEVLERGILSPAADCYAFGVLLWEMLTAEARPVCAVHLSPLSRLWLSRAAVHANGSIQKLQKL